MRTFNEVITVQVSVDTLATQLLATFAADFSHRELLTEAIVTTMLLTDQRQLGMLAGALGGWADKLNYEVGTFYDCPKEELNIYKDTAPDMIRVMIKQVEPYRSGDKVEVEYAHIKSNGHSGKDTRWIDHTKLTLPKPQPVTVESPM